MRIDVARSIVAGIAALGVAGLAHISSGAAATSTEERVRAEAEALADAASKEFSTFLHKQKLAQADTSRPPPAKADRADEDAGPMGWFRSSGREFQNLMRMLAGERAQVHPWDPVSEAARRGDGPRAAPAKPAETGKVAAPAAAPAPPPAPPPGMQAAGERKVAESGGPKPPVKAESAGSSATMKAQDKAAKASETKTLETKGPAGPKAAAAEPRAPAVAPPPDGSKVASAAQPAPALKKDAAVPPATASKAAAAPAPATPRPAAPAKSDAAGPPPKMPSEPPAAAPAKKSATDAAPAPPPSKKAAAEAKPAAPAKEAAAPPAPAAPQKSAAVPTPAAAAPGPVAPAARRRVPRRATVAACKGAGRRVAGAGWYTAQAGDSLWRIAEAHLGSGMAYRRIHVANRSTIADPDQIRPCQRIYIPQRRSPRR